MPSKNEYTALPLRDQVLLRPDTYIGSAETRSETRWVKRQGSDIFTNENVENNEGFIRIFVEIASNALDNVWRSKERGVKCSEIKYSINRETGSFSVRNDGCVIPLEMHIPEKNEPKENKVLNPTLVFGVLLTGNNYDDSEERRTSGRNGLGAKLCNLFSKKFSVEIQDELWSERPAYLSGILCQKSHLILKFSLKSNWNYEIK